jgi:GTPase Era involved in 16S rRNA processing
MEIDTQQQPRREVRLCLVGKTGAGKSTLGNLLCPGANFKTSASAASVTSTAEQARVEYSESGISLVLLDTMGLGDTAHRPEVVRQKITEGVMTLVGGVDFFFLCIKITEGIISLVGGVDFFFLCIKKERFTEENYLIITYAPSSCTDFVFTWHDVWKSITMVY